MLADTDRAPSADLTMASNPVADEEKPDDGLAVAAAPAALFKEEAEQEDTNAVVSPTHTDFVLTRVGGAFVALPPAVPWVGLVGVLHIIAMSTYHEGDLSPLSRMFDVCAPLGCFAAFLGSAVSLRRATGTGTGRGHLLALGAGEVRIGERARRGLSVMYIMIGLVSLLSATRVGTRSKISGRLITAPYARAVCLTGLVFFNGALSIFPWWHALKSASVLVTDAVAETRQAIERCSPTSSEWKTEVLPRVLGLCNETLPLLSRGFGIGVAANFLACWSTAAGFFALFLESGAPESAFWSVICSLLPLGISYDAASASSDCD
eukprot:COSAG05_NODE_5959_length_1051_cov_1.194328_1_plen_320_part_01